VIVALICFGMWIGAAFAGLTDEPVSGVENKVDSAGAKQAAWTIMVFLNADNDLEKYAKAPQFISGFPQMSC
jgi:hypothetical protein